MPSTDDAAFRQALGRFASGVTVVTTVIDGIDHAMTASAFTSVSLDPPLVLVCSHHTNRFHSAVLESRTWGVSVLAESGRKASAWFARRGRELHGQLDDVPHRRGNSGVALLDEAVAWLECTTHEEVVAGDHTILIGRVTSAAVSEHQDAPLLYYRSHYGSIVRSGESEKTIYEGGA